MSSAASSPRAALAVAADCPAMGRGSWSLLQTLGRPYAAPAIARARQAGIECRNLFERDAPVVGSAEGSGGGETDEM